MVSQFSLKEQNLFLENISPRKSSTSIRIRMISMVSVSSKLYFQAVRTLIQVLVFMLEAMILIITSQNSSIKSLKTITDIRLMPSM